MNMSNGGGESGKERKESQVKRKVGSDFDHAIAKIAVAQICESLGFQGFQQSALETLSDIAVRYIQNLGMTAHSYSSLAGRTESNVFDVLQGLEDLGSGLGFVGSSDPDHCLANSGMVMDIVNYVQGADNIPFAYSLRHFPVIRKRKSAASFCQNEDEPPDEHIPPWLPAFPSLHSVSLSKESNEIENGLDRDEFTGEKRKMEKSLRDLHVKFAGDTAGPSTVCSTEAAKGTQNAESNPFLALPLRFGEKEVSVIVPPANLVEAAKSGSDLDLNLVSNHVYVEETRSPVGNCPPNSELRSLIRFKLGFTRKLLGPNPDWASLEDPGLGMTSSWFREDDEEWKKTKSQTIVTKYGENRTEQC